MKSGHRAVSHPAAPGLIQATGAEIHGKSCLFPPAHRLLSILRCKQYLNLFLKLLFLKAVFSPFVQLRGWCTGFLMLSHILTDHFENEQLLLILMDGFSGGISSRLPTSSLLMSLTALTSALSSKTDKQKSD